MFCFSNPFDSSFPFLWLDWEVVVVVVVGDRMKGGEGG